MTDTDKPWSAPSAPPSGPKEGSTSGSSSSGSSAVLASAKTLAPEASSADGPLLQRQPTSFDLFILEMEQREKVAAQQQGQGVGSELSPSVLSSKPMGENGDHPHIVASSDVIQATNERFAAREEENAWLARLESSKRSNVAAPSAGAPSDKSSEADDARIRAGAGEHHRDEQRGWAEYTNTEAAGERQHDSEERRSLGMGL